MARKLFQGGKFVSPMGASSSFALSKPGVCLHVRIPSQKALDGRDWLGVESCCTAQIRTTESRARQLALLINAMGMGCYMWHERSRH